MHYNNVKTDFKEFPSKSHNVLRFLGESLLFELCTPQTIQLISRNE